MSQLRIPVGPEDHVDGPRNAPVTLVEYGDYECPSCGEAHGEVKQLQHGLGDQMRFGFRHFPLSQVHPHALQAAEAAEAAGAQEQFWAMHDLLFANQHALGPAMFIALAEELRLDLPRFTGDLEDHRFLPKIRRDFMGGERSGVTGTPTFFINGVRHVGSFTFGDLLAAIRDSRSAHVF